MDSRSKITAPGDPPKPGALVTGYFDPVTVEHVRRLRQIREQCGAVTVLLRDPPDPILSAQARAEVLAALDVVDAVALQLEHPLEYTVFHEEDADRDRFQRLADHIRRRHAAKPVR